MSENMIMFCYCADQRDTFTSEIPEVQTATRLMYDILARAYAREVLAVSESVDSCDRERKVVM